MEPTDLSEPSNIQLNSVFKAASSVEFFFTPYTAPDLNLRDLGLIGKLASGPCLFEYFRRPPTSDDIGNCMLQLFTWHNKLHKKAEQEGKEPLSEELSPRLWVIIASPTEALLASFLEEFGTQPDLSDEHQGIYFLEEDSKTSLIAINQLPVTPETLWLRMLGRETVLEQAVTEFLALPKNYPLRNRILKLAGNWYADTEGCANAEDAEELTEEDKELLTGLLPIYQQWQKETASAE